MIVRWAALSMSWLATTSFAQEFLTIESTGDRLIRVDQNSGSVTEIGPIGFNSTAPDFERFGRDLYLLSAATAGAPVGFAVIDEQSGAVPPLTPFHLPGQTLQTAEGITSDGHGLLVTVDTTAGEGFDSNLVTRLDPATGTLTPVVTIPNGSTPDGEDMDGIAFDPVFGDLVAVDSSSVAQETAFFRVDLGTGGVTPLFSLPPEELGGFAISPFIEGDHLWITASAAGPPKLVRFDRNGASWTLAGSTTILAGDVTCYALTRPGPCNNADFDPPFGVLDLADINAFVGSFSVADPGADLNGDELVDLSDINAFMSDFVAGCP